MPSPAPDLIGRAGELAAVTALLDGVGTSGALAVIDGDPGVGKTALATRAVLAAEHRGLTVLQASGVETEWDVPYAALSQLLQPVRGAIDDLPEPQRVALQVAFGELQGPPSNLLHVGLATLTLLSDRAAGSLVVVDDLQWVDPATRSVLAFVARRVRAEPVVLLLLARTDGVDAEWRRIDAAVRISLPPLGPEDAETLLSRVADAITPVARRRVLETALGNPLALIELGAPLLRDFAPDELLPLTERLVRAFAHRMTSLDAVARTVLLVAAVSRDDTQTAVLSASSRIAGREVRVQDLDALLRTGLLRRHVGRIVFEHPLVRSAAVQSATEQERAQAHRAVAAVLPAGSDRALWHLTTVAGEPDDALASALEATADRCRAANDLLTAEGAYERAAELSESADERARRLYLAAETGLQGGRVDRSAQLAAEAQRSTSDRALRARIAWLQELHPSGGLWRGAWEGALQVIDELHAAGEDERALTSLQTMAFQIWGQVPYGPVWPAIIERARAFGAAEDDPRLLLVEALGDPAGRSGSVRERIARIDPSTIEDGEQWRLLVLAASLAGSLTEVERLVPHALEALRRQGNRAGLALLLIAVSSDRLIRGDAAEAVAECDEAEEYARELGDPFLALAARATGTYSAAVQGRPVDPDRLRTDFPEAAVALAVNPLRAVVVEAKGVGAAARGRFAEAAALLREVVDPGGSAHHWAYGANVLGEFVDAAVRSGSPAEARAAVDRLAATGSYAAAERNVAQLLFSRAVLADGRDPDRAFRDACDVAQNPSPRLRARAALSYGEWLRRQRRIAEARVQLRSARDELDRLGNRPWAEVARAELRAAGEVSAAARPHPGDALTAQEDRVVQLAAKGLTNRQIGQTLYLSPRTVGAHLYAAFPKLGITSRTELAAALER